MKKMKWLCFLLSFLTLAPMYANPGTPEINFPLAAREKRESLRDIYLVSLIKNFRHNGTIYTAGRIVKIYKGTAIPCYSVVIFELGGVGPGSLMEDEEIREHNSRVVILGVGNNQPDAILLGECKQSPISESQYASLSQEIPPLAGLYYLPGYVECDDVAETTFGQAMYDLLEK